MALFSFSGVLLIIQPRFLFGEHTDASLDIDNFTLYVGLVVLAALAYSFNMLFVHFIGKAIPPDVFVLQSNVGMILVTGLLCAARPNPLATNDITWPLLGGVLMIVLTGFVAQKCTILANSQVKPSSVMPFGYLSVAVAFLADYYIYDIHFGWMAKVGMLMTSLGLLGNMLMKKYEHKVSEDMTDRYSNA
jgi:drug/metabolite transporter (DMT)-like permease